MSVKKDHINNSFVPVIKFLNLKEILHERIIKFNIYNFNPEGRILIKRGINTLVNIFMVHPENCIQKINKLILYKLAENKFE